MCTAQRNATYSCHLQPPLYPSSITPTVEHQVASGADLNDHGVSLWPSSSILINDLCPICQTEPLQLRANDGQLGRLDCGHLFCFACIKYWCCTQSTSCPTCNAHSSNLTRWQGNQKILEHVSLTSIDRRQKAYLTPDEMEEEAYRLSLCVVCGKHTFSFPRVSRACLLASNATRLVRSLIQGKTTTRVASSAICATNTVM